MLQLPRAVNTQALSSAGILRMVNKAADAVNKMTIKMNESDAVSGREGAGPQRGDGGLGDLTCPTHGCLLCLLVVVL